MSDYFIQDRTNILQTRPLQQASERDRTTARNDLPPALRTLNAEQFNAFVRLAARGSILTGRPDIVVKNAKKMPEAIYIDSFWGTANDIRINRDSDGSYTVYWDLILGSNWKIQTKDGISYPAKKNPGDTDPRHNIFQANHAIRFATLNELLAALDNFENQSIGNKIRAYLEEKGYITQNERRLQTDELLFREDSDKHLLSWLEYEDIWTAIRVSQEYYAAQGVTTVDETAKNQILRRALRSLGIGLIEKVYRDNSTSDKSVAEIMAARELIKEFWADSQSLRGSTTFVWETAYDTWVAKLLSELLDRAQGLDAAAVANFLSGERAEYTRQAEEILRQVQEALAQAADPAEAEAKVQEAEEALRRLTAEAERNGIPGIAAGQTEELNDYKNILRIYKDTDSKARQENNPDRFRQTISSGQKDIDRALQAPQGVEKYADDTPIKRLAADLKLRLGNIPEPAAIAEPPESVSSALAAFNNRYINRYRDALIGLGNIPGTKQNEAQACLNRRRNLNDHLATLANDNAKRKAIDELEDVICALLNLAKPVRGKR